MSAGPPGANGTITRTGLLGYPCAKAFETTTSSIATADRTLIIAASSPGAYLIASGFTGEPTAPVIGSAGATNRNS